MDFLAALDADCRALGEALRAGDVPRARRKEAREILQKVALELGQEETAPLISALRDPARQADRMLWELRSPSGSTYTPLAIRLEHAFWPVRLEGAIDPRLVRKIVSTYTALIDRLEAGVYWFWEQCGESPVGRAEAKTPSERALDEYGGEEMEYVWGRKKR